MNYKELMNQKAWYWFYIGREGSQTPKDTFTGVGFATALAKLRLL